MRYSLIFTGQGAQRPGMGKAFYDKYEASRSVFDEVDNALGFALSELIFEGTPEELAKTAITQPAIMTVSMAAFRAVETELGGKLAPCSAAGHSLGEFSALVASGAISLSDGVRLVHLRGRLMQDAVPVGEGEMNAVIGLTLEEVERYCEKYSQNEVCQVANVNSPTQIVISGHAGAVERVSKAISEDGSARVVPLRVSAPFHSELMRPVADELKKAMDSIEWKKPAFPIVTNAEAQLTDSVDEIKGALYKQTYSPVLWCQSVLAMEDYGNDGYIELGPGSVLSGLVRKTCCGKRPYPVSDLEGLDRALKFLKGGDVK